MCPKPSCWGLRQDVFNLLPNLGVEELTRSFAVKGNDMMLVIYLASLVRSVLALHNLLCNKVLALSRRQHADMLRECGPPTTSAAVRVRCLA